MKKTIILSIILLFALTVSSMANYPVYGVTVMVKNTDTGKEYKTKTNKKGKFSFKKLPAGTYTVSMQVDKKKYSVIDKRSSTLHVVSPRDAASGLPTGKRQHKPISVTKELDKASPKLAQACRDWVKDTYQGKDVRNRRPLNSSTVTSNSKSKTSSRVNKSSKSQDYNGTRSNRSAGSSRGRDDRNESSSTMDNMMFAKEIDKASPKITLTLKSDRLDGHVTILK